MMIESTRSRSWIKRLALPLFVAAVVLAACGPTGAATGQVEDPGNERSERAPDFTVTVYQGADVLGGEEVQFSELLEQGNPIVLNFWAGLCPPCRIEMPDLESVYQDRAAEILLLGVDVGPFTNLGTREEGRALLQELGVSYPTGTTFDEGIMEQYQVLGMPSTYFITPEGEIVRSWAGLLTEAKLEELVDELVSASG